MSCYRAPVTDRAPGGAQDQTIRQGSWGAPGGLKIGQGSCGLKIGQSERGTLLWRMSNVGQSEREFSNGRVVTSSIFKRGLDTSGGSFGDTHDASQAAMPHLFVGLYPAHILRLRSCHHRVEYGYRHLGFNGGSNNIIRGKGSL